MSSSAKLCLALLAAATLACKLGKQPPGDAGVIPREQRKSPAQRDFPSDAPASKGPCTKHDECAMIVWDGPLPPDPCCDQRVGYVPVTRSYLTWMDAYQKRHCAGVSCPPSPFPGAEPSCCAATPRCVSGVCVSACDDPSADLPHVSHLDSRCPDH